jgi:hypothetical protein
VVYGDSFVEDVAGALPLAGFGGDCFEVLQDAAFEVVDLGEALLEHVGRGLFAADAAGAEHGDFAVAGGVEVFADVVGEVGEGVERGSDGAGEGSDGGLVGVTGVEEEDFGVGEEGVPVVGVDVLAGARGVDGGVAEGDDLALELELEAAEGRRFGGGEFDFGAGEAGAVGEEVEEVVDEVGRAGHGAVDAFGGDEGGAEEVGGGEGGTELVAEGCGIGEREEAVEGGDGVHADFSLAVGRGRLAWHSRSREYTDKGA